MRRWYPGPWDLNQSSTSVSTRRQIEVLGRTGFRPRRVIPRTICRTSASGWSVVIVMSWSAMVLILCQSLSEVLDEDFLLTFCRLAEGNYSDLIGGLRVHERDNDTLEKTQSHKSPFLIIKPAVFKRIGQPPKYALDLSKIQAMGSQVGETFGFVPNIFHGDYIYDS